MPKVAARSGAVLIALAAARGDRVDLGTPDADILERVVGQPLRRMARIPDSEIALNASDDIADMIPKSRVRQRLPIGFVVKPLTLSHSAGVIFLTVTLKVQMWPSGSLAR